MKLNDLLRLNLQFFADDAENEQQPDETKLDASESVSATQEPEEKTEKTFTQSELDELVRKRLERERKKYEGFDELKAKAAEYEKAIEEKRLAELSEQERLQEIAKKHEEEKQLLAQQLADLQAKTKQQAIVNAFIKAAPSVNIPADRIDAALKLADISAVNVGDDGEVEGLDSVMSTLVEQYSFLAAATKTAKPIGDASNGAPERTDKTKEQLLEEAAAKFKRTGKPEDMAAYSKLKRELGL